jgi:hypothetical protein
VQNAKSEEKRREASRKMLISCPLAGAEEPRRRSSCCSSTEEQRRRSAGKMAAAHWRPLLAMARRRPLLAGIRWSLDPGRKGGNSSLADGEQGRRLVAGERRRRLIAGGRRPASGDVTRGAGVRASEVSVGVQDRGIRDCRAGPYQPCRYVSGDISNIREKKKKSDTPPIRIGSVSDTYPYPVRIGYAIRDAMDVSM